jgi:hypothetical protein
MSRWLYQLSYGPIEQPDFHCRPYMVRDLRGHYDRLLSSGHGAFCQIIMQSLTAAITMDYPSIKLLSLRLRVGCRNLRKALASICLMRSRVTVKSWPTSSRV